MVSAAATACASSLSRSSSYRVQQLLMNCALKEPLNLGSPTAISLNRDLASDRTRCSKNNTDQSRYNYDESRFDVYGMRQESTSQGTLQ